MVSIHLQGISLEHGTEPINTIGPWDELVTHPGGTCLHHLCTLPMIPKEFMWETTRHLIITFLLEMQNKTNDHNCYGEC